MKNIFSTITQRTMKQNRSRTIVTIIGVVLSTAMVAAVTTFGVSIQDFLIKETINQRGNWHLEMNPVTYEDWEEIRRDKRVEEIGTTTSHGYAKAQGLEEDDLTPYFHINNYSAESLEMVGPKLSEGRFPENDREIMVPEYLIAMQKEEERISLGDTLVLEVGKRMQGDTELSQWDSYMSADNPEFTPEMLEELGGEESLQQIKTEEYKVVGIYNRSELDFTTAAAYELLAGPAEEKAENCGIVVRLKSPRDVNAFEEELLNRPFQTEGRRYSRNDTLLRWQGVEENDNFLKVFGGLLAIVIGLIVVASISLIYNAFSISMRERTVQFGLLSSVGATKKQLRKSLQYEARSVCLVGIPLGLASGVTGIGITLTCVGKMLSEWIYGTESKISVKISAEALLAAAVTAFVTVQISAWLPARRLKKISPMEAVRSSGDIQKETETYYFGRKVQNTKALERKLRRENKRNRRTEKFFGLEGMLAEKNYWRDKRKYRATVISLTLSIVLFVTAGAFVLYLEKAGLDVFSESEVDISISRGVPHGAGEKVPADLGERIVKELQEIEGIEEVYNFRRDYYALRVPGEQVPEEAEYLFYKRDDGMYLNGCYLFVLPDDQFVEYAKEVGADPEKYLNQKELKAICMDRVRQYDGQKYSNISILQKEEGITFEAGSYLALSEDPDKSGVMEDSFRITALDSAELYPRESTDSYFSAVIAFVAAESTFEQTTEGPWKEEMMTCVSIMSEDYKRIFRELTGKAEDKDSALYGCSVYNMNEDEEQSANIKTVIQVFTMGFVILMSMIAVANIFNTISTNLCLRRREFAMLRSVGMTEKGFRKMMGYECLIYGLRSILYGVVLSAGSSYLIYRVICSGVETGYMLPWTYWLISALAVFLVVGLTMMYTMRRMQRDNVIDVLKQNG